MSGLQAPLAQPNIEEGLLSNRYLAKRDPTNLLAIQSKGHRMQGTNAKEH